MEQRRESTSTGLVKKTAVGMDEEGKVEDQELTRDIAQDHMVGVPVSLPTPFSRHTCAADG
jgi:hypothetical protein